MLGFRCKRTVLQIADRPVASTSLGMTVIEIEIEITRGNETATGVTGTRRGLAAARGQGHPIANATATTGTTGLRSGKRAGVTGTVNGEALGGGMGGERGRKFVAAAETATMLSPD